MLGKISYLLMNKGGHFERADAHVVFLKSKPLHIEYDMAIRVRYFASLRERMGRIEDTLVAEDISTVCDVWRVVGGGQPLPENILCAVNMEYADARAAVKDGDEVAFFPPVTGG